MGAAIGQILSFAIGVAVSPIPIIAVILMLFSRKATVNSVSFLVGWMFGLTLVGVIVLAVGLEASSGGESDTSGTAKLVIGILFVGLAIKNWVGRPRGDEEPTMPGWMESIDDFNAAKSFGLAFVLAAINPKNLGLTIAAVATISSSGLETGEEYIVLLVFVILASLTIIAPVVYNLVMGEKAEATLTEMKSWLISNNNVVMAVLLLIIGAKLIGDGISVLS